MFKKTSIFFQSEDCRNKKISIFVKANRKKNMQHNTTYQKKDYICNIGLVTQPKTIHGGQAIFPISLHIVLKSVSTFLLTNR